MSGMLPKKVHDRQKAALMEATVKAVAESGVENLTTKNVELASGVKVVYIYRYFENKDDMVAKTFGYADGAFAEYITASLPIMQYTDIDYELRCRALFKKCWDFIMEYPDWLIFYIRYYYSSSFQKYAYSDHMRRYEELTEKMKPACHPSADAQTVLHHLLDTLLGQARKQIMHPIDSERAQEDAFWLLFSVIKGGQHTAAES